ncbi:MAG: hypothetical protein ACPLKZ_05280 [Candidatus Bathyarchaeales archaeon]
MESRALRLFQNAEDEIHVKVTHNLYEACKLPEVDFEYIVKIDGTKGFQEKKIIVFYALG